MLPTIVSRTLYYLLGIIPPSMAALHAASTKCESDLHYWLRYLLLFATLETVVFPAVDPVLHLLPVNLWPTAKLGLVVSLIVPSAGLLRKCFDVIEKNGEDYGRRVNEYVQVSIAAPIRGRLEALTASLQQQQQQQQRRSSPQ